MVLRPVALLVSAALAALIAVAPAVAADTSLVEVEPANGAALEHPPDAVVLTFSRSLDPDATSARVAAPRSPARPAAVEVDGARAVVDVPRGGTGEYVVHYQVRPAEDGAPVLNGSVGFSVDPDGEQPAGGGGPWAAASALAVAGLAAALVVTYRRLPRSP